MIEKRFEQVKTVHEIAPVFLKDEGRIEALFTLYFLALLVQALIERELRLAMKREHIDELPLYPEQRQCRRPTTEQILRLFSLAERHKLIDVRTPCMSSTCRSRPAASGAHVTRRLRARLSVTRSATKF
ncbi:hypothetical protein ACU4GI_19755 [Cupriavidus basilensis]